MSSKSVTQLEASAFVKETFVDVEAYFEAASNCDDLLLDLRSQIARLRDGSVGGHDELLELRLLSRNARYTRDYNLDSDFSDLDESAIVEAGLPAPFSQRSLDYLRAAETFTNILPSDLASLSRLNAMVRSKPEVDHVPRSTQNWLTRHRKPGSAPEDAIVAIPPAPEHVEPLLQQLGRFEEIPNAVGAALALTFFFEIHPFEDGNGRAGRVLFDAMLRRWEGFPYPCVLDEIYFEVIRDVFMVIRQGRIQEGLRHAVKVLFDLIVRSLKRAQHLARITSEDVNTALALRPENVDPETWASFVQLTFTHERVWALGVANALEIEEETAELCIGTLKRAGLVTKLLCEGIDRVSSSSAVVSELGELI